MRVFITGVTGQDGSYLAEHLNECGYEVWGLVRSRRHEVHEVLRKRWPWLNVVPGDLLDRDLVADAIRRIQPQEIYNLAAFTHVGDSFKEPGYTFMVNGLGAENVFEAVYRWAPAARVYQASTSELYGAVLSDEPLHENTAFNPVSPYGVAKLYAHVMAHTYRKKGLFVACGIAFNHQSERGDPIHVNRKITLGLARIKLGLQTELRLGNIGACRDWGYAPEYIRAFHLMLTARRPEDYVIATGRTISVRKWLDLVSGIYGMDWEKHVVIDPGLMRPTDIQYLVGDASRIKDELGWKADTMVEDLAVTICGADMAQVEAECRRSLQKV